MLPAQAFARPESARLRNHEQQQLCEEGVGLLAVAETVVDIEEAMLAV